MASYLLKPVLVRLLQTYVENGSDMDVNIHVTGLFEVANIVIKTDAVMEGFYTLPFHLKTLTIGKLRLEIPILKLLTSRPLQVSLSQIKIVMEWGDLVNLPSEEQFGDLIKGAISSETTKVWDEFRRVMHDLPGEANILGSDEETMVTKVLNRLLKNVHVRVKDLTLTILLKDGRSIIVSVETLQTYTTDASFEKEIFDHDNNRIMRRIFCVQGMSVRTVLPRPEQDSPGLPRHALTIANEGMNSHPEVRSQSEHLLLKETDAHVHMIFDNRGDKPPDQSSMDFRVLFTSSLDIDIRPGDLALLKRIVEEISEHGSRVERATARYLRKMRRGTSWEKLTEEYLALCLERWHTNFQPVSSSPRQLELELLLDGKDVRYTIEKSMRNSAAEIVDPALLAKSFHSFLDPSDSLSGYFPLKRAGKFPLTSEFDVVFAEEDTLGLELDMEESERTQQLVIYESNVYPEIIIRGTVVSAVNGFSVIGLDLDDQLLVLSKAKRPTSVRFFKPQIINGMTIRLLIPSLTVQLGPNSKISYEDEREAALVLEPSSFQPHLRFSGVALQYDSYISSVTSARISLMGADGPLLNGGIGRPPAYSRETFSSSAAARTEWLERSSVELDLVEDDDWRTSLNLACMDTEEGSCDALIRGCVLTISKNLCKYQGRIGSVNLLVTERLQDFLTWTSAVSEMDAIKATTAEPKTESSGSDKVLYEIDLEAAQVQIRMEFPKARATWKSLVCAVERLQLKSSADIPNRIQAKLAALVRADETKILGLRFNTFQIALDQPDCMGISLNVHPEPIVVSEVMLSRLMNTKKEFEERFAFLSSKPTESTRAPDDQSIAPPAMKSLRNATGAATQNIVSVTEACGQALSDVFSFTPERDEEFTLSPTESRDFYLAMKRLGHSVSAELAIKFHNLGDLIESLQAPVTLPRVTARPSLVRVGLVVSDFQLTVYKFMIKVDHVIVGAATAPELSVRCEVKNLRMDDARLKADEKRRSFFPSRFFIIKETVFSYNQSSEFSGDIGLDEENARPQPFIDVESSEIRTPDVSSVCPLELQQLQDDDIGPRDDIHVAVYGVKLRITYDLLDSLQTTLLDVTSLLPSPVPESAAGLQAVKPDHVPPLAPPIGPESNVQPSFPIMCASVRFSGFSIAFDDLTRRCEKARRMQRYQNNEAAIGTALQESNGLTTVAISFSDGLSGGMGDSEIRSIFLTFVGRSEDTRAKLTLNHISLSMSVNEVQVLEERSHTRFTEVFQRSRTILNPVGITVNLQQRKEIEKRKVTLVAITVDKPLSFSVWAEELATFQDIVFAQAPDAVQGLALHEELKTVTPPTVTSPRPLPEMPTSPRSAMGQPKDARQAARTLSGQKRVTFQSQDSIASSSHESFYTAMEEEDDASAAMGKDDALKEIFVVRMTCQEEIGLEIVKRSLARISPDAFLPVLWFVMTPVQLSLYTGSMGRKDFTASCLWGMEARIYNLRLAVWEPLVEHFDTELFTRRVAEAHSKLQLSVVSRVNVNISEVNARLLQKLINDFSANIQGSTKAKRKLVSGSKKSNATTYLLANETGDDLIVENLFQVGCGSPGTLKIEIRDAWTLPDRARWQKHPKIEGVVHPWKEKMVIDHRPPSPNAPWVERPLAFAFRYLGTTTEFPMLEITVNDDHVAMIELASHIVDPKPGGTSEWVGLRKNGGTIASELLLKIIFESDPLASTKIEKWAPLRVRSSEMTAISFDRVSPNKREMLKSLNFVRRGAQNTMRGAHLSVNVFNNIFGTQLLVDETGSYAINLDHEKTVGMDSLSVSHMEVFVKSAMRPGGKRVIQIESPLVIQNETNVPIEILITDREFDEDAAEKDSDILAAEDPLLLSDEDEEKEEKSDSTSDLGAIGLLDGLFRWFEVVQQSSVKAADESSSLTLTGTPLYVVLESNELPLPLKVGGCRIAFLPSPTARMTHWKLYGRVADNDSWILLLQVPSRGSSREDGGASERESHEEKHELHRSLYEFAPVDVRSLRLEWFPPTSVVTSEGEPGLEGRPRLRSEPDVFDIGGSFDSFIEQQPPPVRATSTLDVASSKKKWTQSSTMSLSAPQPGAVLSPRPAQEVFASLGIKSLEIVPALEFSTWRCRLCLEENDFCVDRCSLCNCPRKSIISSSAITPTPTPGPPRVRKGLSSASLAISAATEKATSRLKKSFRQQRPAPRKKRTGFFKPIAASALASEDRSLRKQLDPGDRFAIPIRFLFVKDDPFKIYVRPAPTKADLSWAMLVERLSELKDSAPPRTWLRCTDADQKSKVVLSAHIRARFVPLNTSERGRSREDKRPNRFKIGVVPWLIIQNALPYALSLRFFDGLTPREDVAVLQPGAERGFMNVDEQNLVQFRLEGYNPFFGWSGAVHPYREDTVAYSSSTSTMDPVFMKRAPKRKEVLSFVHERSGKTLRLVMERSNDSKASLRCVVYAVCWMYNYSDVGLSVKGGRSLLGTASAAAASRTSTTGSTPEESYMLSPQGSPGSHSHDLLPALIHTGNDVVRVSGVMGWDHLHWQKWTEDERWPHDIQPMQVIQVAKMKRMHPTLAFSKPRFSVKLTSSVFSCDFIFATLAEIRLVTVEVRRPVQPPFTRSHQVIVRPRFILINSLPSCTVLFKEAFLMSLAGGTLPSEYLNELVTAEMDIAEDDDIIPHPRRWLGWLPGADLQGLPESGTEPLPNLTNNAVGGISESEAVPTIQQQQESHSPETASANTHREHPPKLPHRLTESEKETRLAYNQPIPYHFVRSKHSQKFVFSIAGEEGKTTSWSGVISLSNAEGVHCVLLRDKDGSAHEGLDADSDAGMPAMRVRVEISPRPNGSTMVIFSEDAPCPSFQIENLSQYHFEVRQSQTTKGNLILAPRSTRPIGWDEPMKPTSVTIRALVPYDPAEHKDTAKPGAFASMLVCFHVVAQNSVLVRESGKTASRDDELLFVPASEWQTYAMETVSEREPLQLLKDDRVLRAEGVVQASTLVLRLSEDFRQDSRRASQADITSTDNAQGEVDEEEVFLASEMYDPTKCLLAVRVERGQDLDVCEKWQGPSRKKFHPYVVASVAGHTKQSNPKLNGDLYNPDWVSEKPLLFECQYMPKLISFSVLNYSTDEREVLAIKREDLPRSLFLVAAQKGFRKRKPSRMKRLSVSLAGEASRDEIDQEEQPIEVVDKSLVRTGDTEAFTTALERAEEEKVAESSGDNIITDDENEDDDMQDNNGWIAIGSERWRALLEHDRELERRESEYAMTGLRLVGKSKTLDDFMKQPDPYDTYESFVNHTRIAGSAQDGCIELGPMFVKESSELEQLKEIVKSDGAARTTAAKTSSDKTRGAAAAATTEEVVTEAQKKPKLRVSIKVMRLPRALMEEKVDPVNGETKLISPLKEFINGVETDLSFRLTSLGVSIINVAKRQEIAYACIQRVFYNRITSGGGFLAEMSVGNVQLDNKVPNAQFPVSINRIAGPPIDTKGKVMMQSPFAHVKVYVHTMHPSVIFVETFRASVSRLNIALEERFLGEVAGVFVRSSQDLNLETLDQAFVKEEVAIVPYRDSKIRKESVDERSTSVEDGLQADRVTGASGEQQDVPSSTAKVMIYLDSFEIHPLRVTINLDLEGGREIDEPDDSIAADVRLKIPLLTLEVRDLILRIAGMRRSGWFVSPGALRDIITRHFIHQGLLNSGRILTNTNWAGNPLQAGKSVASGFYFLFREPVMGARTAQNPFIGFFQGLSAGSTALFANVATGLSETVHGLSNTTVNAFSQLDKSIEFDITTRPISSVVEVLRDVSGALASSAREITDEVVAMRFAKPVPMRQVRELGPEGLIVPYGGGYLPQTRMIVEERMKAQIIQRAWRRYWKNKLEASKKIDLSEIAKEAQTAKNAHQAENEKPRFLVRVYRYIVACCISYKNELDAVRNAGASQSGAS